MTNEPIPNENHCPLCELGLSETLTVVSRHRTTTGTVVYARCECGRLSMWHEATAAAPPRLRTMARHTVGLLDRR